MRTERWSHLASGFLGGLAVWAAQAGWRSDLDAPSPTTAPIGTERTLVHLESPREADGIALDESVFAPVSHPAATVQLTQLPLPRLGRPQAAAQPRTASIGQSTPESSAPPRGPLPEDLTEEERISVEVYERCNRSAVNINTRSVRPEGILGLEGTTEGAGSGVVLDAAGHVLTNFHVVEGAQKVAVTLFDGESYDAHFVGADPVNDVAVLRITAPAASLYPVTLGDSSRLRVGMKVFAIGNPFGLERTLTTGVVSSLNRSLKIRDNRTVKSIIQIDAAINPGNSGGPLLDTKGRLIGMNTAIASSTGQSAGVGFAIPVNLIDRIVPQIVAHGKFIRPDVGIVRVYETDKGLLVASLVTGGPAEKAGVRGPAVVRKRRGPFLYESLDRSAADLITAVDETPIKNADDFLDYVERKQPGETVRLTVVREGRTTTVDVPLGSDQ